MSKVKSFVYGAAGFVVAFVTAIVLYTAWVDHNRIALIWQLEIERATAAQKQQVVP